MRQILGENIAANSRRCYGVGEQRMILDKDLQKDPEAARRATEF